MEFHAILSQLQSFEVGPLTFHTYGLITGLAVAALIYYVIKHLPNKLTERRSFWIMIIFVMVSAILGARIFYVVFNWSRFRDNLISAVRIWEGGINLFGVLTFGYLSARLFWNKQLKKEVHNISFKYFLDTVLTGTALAQFIGRWANFVNQELFGFPTNLPWGIYIPPHSRPDKFKDATHFHPAFLYESILNLINFLILNRLLKVASEGKYRNSKKTGLVTAVYCLNYGIIRIVVERFRIDTKPILFNLKTNDILSIGLIFVGLYLFIKNKYEFDNPSKIKK
jgi:phosphatidylglycerol:prolipoprotein diacylglycerol transferase